MAIKEKPSVIEFSWESAPNDAESMTYDIVYDAQREDMSVTISCGNNGQVMQCSLEMLHEIVEFFKRKGLIEMQEEAPAQPSGPIPRYSSPVGSHLPMPQIQKKGVQKSASKNNDDKPVNIPQASMDAIPIASFDVPTSQVVLNQPLPKKTEGGININKNSDSEIIERPVIRTRSESGVIAEEMAAHERESLGKGKGKAIKPVHRASEE